MVSPDRPYVIRRYPVTASSTGRFLRLVALPKAVTIWRIHNLGPDAIEWSDQESPKSEGEDGYLTLSSGQSDVPMFTPEEVWARRTNNENTPTLIIVYTTSKDPAVIARVAAANLSGGGGGGGGSSGAEASLEPLSGTPRHVQVNVGTTQIAVLSGLTSGMGAISLYNRSSNMLYIGGSGVTAATGFPVPPSSPFSADLDNTVPLFAIGAAGNSNDVRVLGIGV